ncbi:DUF3600 domain-containing protein [Bacillus sp. JJ1566]|uniref:DUF3600 domain-containing protein n=1 Tax=Bacillus sp. JJ1566 TaxID=3122961 RepID=UPI002FFE0F74
MNKLKTELVNIEIPEELHKVSRIGVKRAKSEMEGKIKKYVRKRLAVCALAVAIIVPTSAFAYQTFLPDEFYGSFVNLKKHIGSATMESYMLLDAKLAQAKGDMKPEEYSHFKQLVKVITASKLEYGNRYGYVDYSQIPAEKLDEVKLVMFEIQPYFDKLNNQPSSKKVLTSSQYKEYINALITYEQIMAQSDIKDSSEIEKIPAELQGEFTKAQAFLMYVNDKQLGE